MVVSWLLDIKELFCVLQRLHARHRPGDGGRRTAQCWADQVGLEYKLHLPVDPDFPTRHAAQVAISLLPVLQDPDHGSDCRHQSGVHPGEDPTLPLSRLLRLTHSTRLNSIGLSYMWFIVVSNNKILFIVNLSMWNPKVIYLAMATVILCVMTCPTVLVSVSLSCRVFLFNYKLWKIYC